MGDGAVASSETRLAAGLKGHPAQISCPRRATGRRATDDEHPGNGIYQHFWTGDYKRGRDRSSPSGPPPDNWQQHAGWQAMREYHWESATQAKRDEPLRSVCGPGLPRGRSRPGLPSSAHLTGDAGARHALLVVLTGEPQSRPRLRWLSVIRRWTAFDGRWSPSSEGDRARASTDRRPSSAPAAASSFLAPIIHVACCVDLKLQ